MKTKNQKVAIFSTGEMPVNAIAEKLTKAMEKRGGNGEILPDLNKIEVSEITLPVIDLEKIRSEATDRRQWAESAGAKLAQIKENLEKIRTEIAKIKTDSNYKFSPSALAALAQLEEAEKKEAEKLQQLQGVKNDAMKKHMEFSALLEEIRGTDPSRYSEVSEIIDRVVKMERFRIATDEEVGNCQKPGNRWPHGCIFFNRKVYVPCFEEAAKSPGHKALEAELRKLVDAAKTSKAAELKVRGNSNLADFEKGKVGMYYFFSPKRTEEAHVLGNGTKVPEKKIGEGHALIEILDLNQGKFDIRAGKKVFRQPYVVVLVRDACGSLSWMTINKRWTPFFWIEKGKVITSQEKRLEPEDFEWTCRLIGTIRGIYAVWHKSQNRSETVPVNSGAIAESVAVI